MMARLDSWLTPEVTHALGWALIHSLWQCLALAALAAVAMMFPRRPAIRYLIAVTLLAAMLAAPVATFFVLLRESAPAHPSVQAPVQASSPARFAVSAIVPPLSQATATPTSHVPVIAQRPGMRQGLLPNAGSPNISSLTSISPNILPWLVKAWLCGVALFSFRFLGGLLVLEYRRPKAFDAEFRDPPARILALAREVERQLGLKRAIRYLECSWLQAPAVIGWVRPIILLPVTALTGLSEAQLRAVIAHELAHIRRFDAVANVLQVMVETLLFYHPAIWWLNKRIRAERELCCDDIAVSLTGDRLEYARALTLMAEWETPPSLAMALNRGPLSERVFHILGRRKFGPARRMLGVMVGLLLIAAAMGGGSALFGIAPFAGPHAKAGPKPTPSSHVARVFIASHVVAGIVEPDPAEIASIRRAVHRAMAARAKKLVMPPVARMLRRQTVAVPELVSDPTPVPAEPNMTLAAAKGPVCALPSVVDSAELKTIAGSALRTVPVAINGAPKQLLLDIGTNPTEISQSTVADLGLPDTGRRADAVYANGYGPGDLAAFTSVSYLNSVALTNVKGSAGDHRDHVRVVSFTIGGATGRNLAFAVAKDPEMGKSKPYDGLMTGDFFRQYDVEVDFARGKLNYLAPTVCADPDQIAYWPHAAVAAIPITNRGGKIQVEVNIQGREIPAVIDTSSAHTVMRRDVAELLLGLKAGTPDMMPDGGVTDGTGLQVYRHTFAEIAFGGGGVTAYNVPTLIETNSMVRNPNRAPILGSRAQFAADPDERIPALTLGMDVLSQLHLYAAEGRQMLYVTAAN